MKKVVHYTFSTYKRKQILVDWISVEIELLIKEVCKEKRFELLCCSVLSEHVHLLIRKTETDSNEYVMKMVKGISARGFFKKYKGNRLEHRKLWGRGYRAFDVVGDEELERTIRYIENQKINGIDKRENWKPRRLVSGFQTLENQVNL